VIYEWDAEKARSNRRKHGVSFDEAVTVFEDGLGQIVDDLRHSVEENRCVLLGLSRRNRLLAVCSLNGVTPFASSARAERRAKNEGNMKKKHTKGGVTVPVDDDDILPEYDFSRSRPNKYARCYSVVLDPDVAAVFPSAGEVNEALRALAGIIQKHRPRRSAAART
jgi:hypothetical protein